MKGMKLTMGALAIAMVLSGCGRMSNTGKGALIGTTAGAAAGTGLGALIGKLTGNTKMGAGIGAAAGAAVVSAGLDPPQAARLAAIRPAARIEIKLFFIIITLPCMNNRY